MSQYQDYQLVIVRHGESEWNKLNLFTGWRDCRLSEKGTVEARSAGKVLKEEGFEFDVAHCSLLTRANQTLYLALDEMDAVWTPVKKHWRLNERHYGALQGANKVEAVEKFGEAQVKIWRRSYDVPPPPVGVGQGRVWTVEKNKLKPHDLKLGGSDGHATQVIAGDIKPGDKVITDAKMPGQP